VNPFTPRALQLTVRVPILLGSSIAPQPPWRRTARFAVLPKDSLKNPGPVPMIVASLNRR